MKKQKNSKLSWYKRHKKIFWIATCGVTSFAILVIYLIVSSDLESDENLIVPVDENDYSNVQNYSSSSLSNSAFISNSEPRPIKVKGHVRKLAEGQHPSLEKKEEAKKMGIMISEDSTYVSEYEKNIA